MHVRPYQKLIVWQEAYKLCLATYKITLTFPGDEKFCLVSQMRRSSYSVCINLAEGNTKKSPKEKIRFIEISHSSLEELHCEMQLAKDLYYIKEDIFAKMNEQIQLVSFLLTKLERSLRRTVS